MDRSIIWIFSPKSCSVVLLLQSRREASRRLFEIAESQQGYFTAKQAKAAGFAEKTHPYHVQVGNWIREYRGIYRRGAVGLKRRLCAGVAFQGGSINGGH